MTLRVLHVIPSVSSVHGGPSQALALMERELCAAGTTVATLTTDDNGPRRRLYLWARPSEMNGATRIYCTKWLDFYKVAPAMLPWLWRHVREFDVVHIHTLFSFASLAAASIATARRVPYIIRPLGTLGRYGIAQRRPWLKQMSLTLVEVPILRGAAAVQFTTEAEWEEAKRLNIQLRAVVVPLAVQGEEAGDAQDLRQHYPVLHNRRVVLYLSRLNPIKNVEALLEAFALIEPERNDVALVIAGDGPPKYVTGLKSLARSLGLGTEVVWLGQVDGALKSATLAVADIFVLPSLSENFGIAAVEAMLMGLPCVLGRGVGIAPQVEKADAGVVVSPEPAALAKALTELLANDARRSALGKRARVFAQQEFSTEVMGDRLLALYRQVAAERSRGARRNYASASYL